MPAPSRTNKAWRFRAPPSRCQRGARHQHGAGLHRNDRRLRRHQRSGRHLHHRGDARRLPPGTPGERDRQRRRSRDARRADADGRRRASETVTVTAETPLIQTQSGERSFSISTEAVQAIAVNGRNYNTLANLAPGVVAGTVNGLRVNQNTLQIDGITSVDTGNNGNGVTLTVDAVQEVRVLTSQLSGGIRPLGGRTDQRGDQERHAAVPRLALCRPAQGRSQRQHVAEQSARPAEAEDQPVGPGLHARRSDRPAERRLEVVLLPEPGIPAGAEREQRDARPRADRAGAARATSRRRSTTPGGCST